MGRQSRLRRLRRSGEVQNAAWAGVATEEKNRASEVNDLILISLTYLKCLDMRSLRIMPPRDPRPKDVPPLQHLTPANPYSSDDDVEADRQILKRAWRNHFGIEHVPDDFLPTMFGEDEEGAECGAPWMGVFIDLLAEKYGSLKEAEPRFRHIVSLLMPAMAKSAVDGGRASDAQPLDVY